MQLARKILMGFLGVLSVLVIALLAAFWTINLVDWNRHKGPLIGLVHRFTDIRIDAMEGFSVKLLRSFRVDYDKLSFRIQDPEQGMDSLRFSSDATLLRVPLGTWLFRKKLIIDSFAVDKARIFMQAVPSKAEQKQDEGDIQLASLPAIFVNQAVIRDARFQYYASAKATPFEILVDRFSLGSPSQKKAASLGGEGTIQDLPFTLLGEVGSFESFQKQKADDPYPTWLHATVGQHSIDLRGQTRFARATTHLKLKAEGPHIEDIKKALHLNIGTIPAYTLQADLDLAEGNYAASAIVFKLGESLLKGSASLDLRQKRPFIEADLRSPLTIHGDWAGLFQADRRYRDPEEPVKPEGQYFSDKPIDASALKAMDLDIKYVVDSFRGEKSGTAIQSWTARIKLRNGDLQIDPAQFSSGNGLIGGSFFLSAKDPKLAVKIKLAAKDIDLGKLLQPVAAEIPVFKLKPTDVARGRLMGHLDLSMTGRTPMELAKTTRGPIELLVEDGALSATLVEASGIDITETLVSWFKGHPLYKMQCGLTAFEAKDGAIRTKVFLLATRDTSLIGKGHVDLVGNKVDFRIAAHPHDFSIGSVRAPLSVSGPLNGIKPGIKTDEVATRTGIAAALGAIVNPALALLPLLETGLNKEGRCRDVIVHIQEIHAKSKQAEKTVIR